jgi:hypothetical protein
MKKSKTKTGIEYLRGVYDKDYRCPLVFDAAEMLQLETMNEFSQWIYRKNYRMSHYNSLWYKEPNITQPHELSELYQKFIQSKNE